MQYSSGFSPNLSGIERHAGGNASPRRLPRNGNSLPLDSFITFKDFL
jgi:hypothetical protein